MTDIKNIRGETIFTIDDEHLRRADFRDAYLLDADLRYADLRGADLRYADLRGANLRRADLRRADLRRADLRGANLRGADLRRADLRGADLDFSVWPLWCGSIGVNVDEKIQRQLMFHAINACRDNDTVIGMLPEELKTWVREFHEYNECGWELK